MFPLGRGGEKKGGGENEFPPCPRFFRCEIYRKQNGEKEKARVDVIAASHTRLSEEGVTVVPESQTTVAVHGR